MCIYDIVVSAERRRLCFHPCRLVCMSVCLLATLRKTQERIFMKFSGYVAHKTRNSLEYFGVTFEPLDTGSFFFGFYGESISVSNILHERVDFHENYTIGRTSYMESWWCHQIKPFPRYWPFLGECTGHRWIPLTKASDAELWSFLWSAPEQIAKQTIETQGVETPLRTWWRHGNDNVEHFWNVAIHPLDTGFVIYVLDPCLLKTGRKTCEWIFMKSSGHDEHDIRHNWLNCFAPD